MSFFIDDILKNTYGAKETPKKIVAATTTVAKRAADFGSPLLLKPTSYSNDIDSGGGGGGCRIGSDDGIMHPSPLFGGTEQRFDRAAGAFDNVVSPLDGYHRSKYNVPWTPVAADRLYLPYYGLHAYSDPSYALNGFGQNVVRSRYWPSAYNFSCGYANDCAHYSKRKGGQIRFTPLQTQALERRFVTHKYLSPDDRRGLADMLKLSDRQVKTWFQNRRAKWRRSNNISTSTDDEKPMSTKRSGVEDDVDDVFDSPQHSPLITVTE